MILFWKCRCQWRALQRIRRAGWMRVFPFRRLFHCTNCGSKMLLTRRTVRRHRMDLTF